MTEAAAPLMTAARRGCIADIRAAIPAVPVDQALRPDADLGPWTAYLAEQEPGL